MATIYKRRWDGGEAYRVQFRHKGLTRFRQFKLLKNAKTFVESLGAADTVIPEPRNAITVEALAQQWLKACARGIDGKHPLDAQTIVTYTGYVNNWIIPELGSKTAQGLLHKDVRDFRDWALETGIERSTVKKILTALKCTLNYGMLTEQVGVNVAVGVAVKSNGRHVEQVVIPSKEDVKKLLTVAKRWHAEGKRGWLRYYAFLLVLVYCGLRLSEARGLPRSALILSPHPARNDASDVGGAVVNEVVGSHLVILQRADKVGVLGPPKSARARRSLVVPAVLRDALRDVLGTHNHAIVFPTAGGNPLDANNLGKRFWSPLIEESGIPYVTMHTLRHFFASRLIEQGESVKEVSVVLGHADEAFTLRVYGHLFKDQENEARRRRRIEALI